MSTPQVSVVMGVYNGADHLEQTLASILSQEGCDLEFVVVDDGSTDETGRILDERAARDTRLRVIHQSNAGLTRALIQGCAEARGEFIARQDAGDVSLPGRLKEQAAALRKDGGLAFVSCGTRYVGPDGEYLFQHAGNGLAATPINIIDIQRPHGIIDGPSSHPSVMFRQDKYAKAGGYREQFYFGQDWDLWYRLGMLGKFQMLSPMLYEAQIGICDISTSNKRLQEELAKLSLQSLRLRLDGRSDSEVLLQASRIRPESNQSSRYKRVSRGCYFLGECTRRNGNLIKARYYFWKSIKHDLLYIKAWLRLVQTSFRNKNI